MKSFAFAAFLVLAALAAPVGASAQIVWDAPPMMRPGAPQGLSLLLLEAHPAEELGAMVQWRQAPAPAGLGFRAGVAEDASGDLAAMFGLDISGPLSRAGGSGEPEVIWWAGAGLGVGDEMVASFPFGIVLGWNLDADGIVFSPYVGGHAALDLISGPGDDLDVDGSFDIGMDLGFDSGLQARFGAGIGGRESFAVGVRLPMSR